MDKNTTNQIVSFILWFCLALVIVLLLIGILLAALCNKIKTNKNDAPEDDGTTEEEKAAIVTEDEVWEVPEKL